MTTNEILEEALAKLDGGKSEVVVDFSSVTRIDAPELRALENLAGAAQKKSVKLALCGVGVGVYKVLKLSKAALSADLHSA
jgi:anti-anti-sigma regulatory factor